MRRITITAAVLIATALLAAWSMERWRYLDPRWQAPAVTVLDAGAEPRAALRYQHTTPPRPFTSVTQEALITFRGVLQGEESQTPPMVLHWEPVANERSWGASITHWRLTSAEGAQELVGAVWIVSVGANGQLKIEPPSDVASSVAKVTERLRRVLAWSLAVPLPDEPVGKGARWTATWRAPVGVGTEVEHLATYTLNDANHTGVDLEVACRLSGQPQRPAERVVVDEIEGDYAGRVVLLLEEATPVQTELAFRAGMSTIEVAGSSGAPTDEERRHGNKIIWRGRLLLQADAVGPLLW